MPNSRWSLRFRRFLRVKPICNAVFWLRFVWYARIRRMLRVYEDKTAVRAHDFSLSVVNLGKPTDRVLKLILPLASIERLQPDGRVLSIGCRFETDLLYLVGYGFQPQNVRGFDMISYSPWIDMGNMHAMDYPDGSWDAVMLGWVVSYSHDPRKAAQEVVRITRDGGVIAVGLSRYPKEVTERRNAAGELAHTIQTVDEILDLFKPYVDTVYWRHDPSYEDRRGAVTVVFSIRKAARAA